jgi:hypothetical protein
MRSNRLTTAILAGAVTCGLQSQVLSGDSSHTLEAKRVQFLMALAHRESSHDKLPYDKKIVNDYGYMGLFQMGGDALVDAQFYQLGTARSHNAWDGKFTKRASFVDVKSVDDYLDSAGAQELAVRAYHDVQWERLVKTGCGAAVGTTISGINVTKSGLIAGAHLTGVGGVLRWIRSQGSEDPMDANQTSVSDYVQEFASFY